jgi:glutamate-1-semialdehyde 2,1-aminomutase
MIDRDQLRKLKDEEDARFTAARPKTVALWERAKGSMPNGVPMAWMFGSYHHLMWAAEGKGAHFRDADGHDYADFNIADMSMFTGYAPEPLVRAVSERVAAGNQFLLPTEDSVFVAEELARRWGLPKWQFTLSASQANTEAIRVSRHATGRDKVLMFEGKYHGHFDEALVERADDGSLVPEEFGLARDATSNTVLVPWNDPAALERALETREIALVLTEPCVSNNVVMLLPQPGFHQALRDITRATGTLLAFDETHTLVTGPGGLVRHWSLEPDIVVAGKSIAGGVPLGTYGMTEEVAAFLHQEKDADGERHDLVATGGTLFGNALQMAAARAILTEVLTEDAYDRTAELGETLATGMRAAVASADLPWYIHHLYPRAGYTFAPEPPRDAAEAWAADDHLLRRVLRIWLANRGVWEAIIGAGPVVPVPGTAEDVALYLDAFRSLLEELTR